MKFPIHLQSTQIDAIYEGCGTTKTCFGFPDNCVNSQTCQTISAVTVRGERYEFEIRSSYRK